MYAIIKIRNPYFFNNSSIIHWGFIGCGVVAENKSGPAFSKIDGSKVVAVMRRDAIKAEDYATRHKVSKWYTNAQQLIEDPNVNIETFDFAWLLVKISLLLNISIE